MARRDPTPADLPDGVRYADTVAWEIAVEQKRAAYWRRLQTRRAETQGRPGRCAYCGRLPTATGRMVHEIGCFRP